MPAKLRIFNSSGSSIFSGTILDEDSVVECKIDSEICFVLKGPSQADVHGSKINLNNWVVVYHNV